MNRRAFFARLGLGALAAVVVPEVLVAKKNGPEMFVPVTGPSLAIKDAKGEWVEIKEVKNFDSGGWLDFDRAVADERERVKAATARRTPEPWYPEGNG